MPEIEHPMYGPLTLPADFPRQAAEEIEWMLRTDPPPRWWFHFGGAWIAMAYRFRAAAEASDSWAASFSGPDSDAPPMNERYAQERDLFGFVSNASSTLDCLAYGIAALSMSRSTAFDVLTARGRRLITFDKLCEKAPSAFGSGDLSRALVALEDDPTR